ncbi:MAG: adenylyl-sulfate kinase [Sphingomonadaceae bacterium]|nr:adenylyl-sulfate kinase [Sphingomonadaceae bacterium]
MTAPRRLLRVLTCGSVDDGKSTLIGRLLHDCGALPDDAIEQLHVESRARGFDGPDYSLLVDGLEAEREQGITIDVAYRYFDTPAARVIVADCPGHEQYTRNMATGASTADLAILLIDARKGVLPQTRRHAFVAQLLGVREAVLAINKIDLAGFDEDVFRACVAAFEQATAKHPFARVSAIPTSALAGDNVVARSKRMPWYRGPTLREALELANIDRPEPPHLRFPVQRVQRDGEGRLYQGWLAGGRVGPGDRVVVAASGREAVVTEVMTPGGGAADTRGCAAALRLDRELDISRGDLIAAPDARPEVADQVQAKLIWMAAEPLLPGRDYLAKVGTRTLRASVTSIRGRIDIETFDKVPARQLELNDIGVCHLRFSERVAFDAYADNRATGSFILIDRQTSATVGAGLIDFALRRAANVSPQALDVDRAARARLLGQRPRLLWFTGLSGAGKSTIANLVEKRLHAEGRLTYTLDGDNVRHGLNRDLGFSPADRVENIRRVAEVSKLMLDAGLIVLTAFISPFRAERAMARELVGADFIEVFIDTPLSEAEQRDVKGLYARARRGEIANFTGISSPYEPPETPEIRIHTTRLSAEEAAELICGYLTGLQP